MWLELDLDGISFRFRITEYKKSTADGWDTEWCRIDMTLHARPWLHYQIVSQEVLLSSEVEEIQNTISAFLNGELAQPEALTFIEPDFELGFNPDSSDMDFSIWIYDENRILSANRLVLCFDRNDLKKLLDYLQTVTGKVE